MIVGGEVVAGSSRLNAGTAQKITLNTISTSVMVLLGKTYGNLMVDVRATNTKLRDRAVRIVQAVTGVSLEQAVDALETAGWNTKLASLVAATGMGLAYGHVGSRRRRGAPPPGAVPVGHEPHRWPGPGDENGHGHWDWHWHWDGDDG